MGVKLDRILSSPLDRAVQSAEIVSQEHGSPDIAEVGFLVPPGDFESLAAILGDLAAEGIETVALVGHAPLLDELLGMLVANDPEIGTSLSKAGAACVEISADGGEAELRWLMRREQLAMLCEK
jgi:phosphohistidine phosphatase SixA